MPLNETEKKLIASLIASSTFEALRKVIQDRIDVIKSENPERETQFKTILKVGENKGRVSEMKELLVTLENYAKRI